MPLSDTTRRRLGLLIDLLKDDYVQVHFDYRHWISSHWKGSKDLRCGTMACAGGWATTISELIEAGLHLNPSGEVSIQGSGRQVTGLEALSMAFEIPLEQAFFLFAPNWHVKLPSGETVLSPVSSATALDVANHIQEYVRVDGDLSLFKGRTLQPTPW